VMRRLGESEHAEPDQSDRDHDPERRPPPRRLERRDQNDPDGEEGEQAPYIRHFESGALQEADDASRAGR